MEIIIKDPNPERGNVLSFDGRVLEMFAWRMESRFRYHIRQIVSIQLTPPDKHGKQQLTGKFAGGPGFTEGLVDVAPDQVSAAQELVAAVVQALHTP
jgi:hypothetical protein